MSTNGTTASERSRLRVCVVGSSTYFLSGISYYTYFLTKTLNESHTVTAVLMRKLIPRRLYPGRARVGKPITALQTSELVPTFEGIDWYAVPSLWRAVRFIRRHKPDIMVFQWWTGSVVLWYLVLQRVAHRQGAKSIVELHEDIDSGELRWPVLPGLARRGLQRLVRNASAYVVHSEFDAERIGQHLGLPDDRVWVIPHGPYPMAVAETSETPEPVRSDLAVRLLFFGTIRPYKGLEVLVDAFERLAETDPGGWNLTVVGEVWEGWHLPLNKIERSPHRDLITVRAGYVPDDEVPGIFADADLVVLPYLRASASGPLQLTMSAGLPVVVSAVGGLVEAARDYPGATFAAPGEVASLAAAIRDGAAKIGAHHDDPAAWTDVLRRFNDCFGAITRPR